MKIFRLLKVVSMIVVCKTSSILASDIMIQPTSNEGNRVTVSYDSRKTLRIVQSTSDQSDSNLADVCILKDMLAYGNKSEDIGLTVEQIDKVLSGTHIVVW